MHQRSTAANGSATLVGQVRLFRNQPAVRWEYRVHEQILPSLRKAGHAVRFTDIAIEHSGYLDPALRHRKLERNLRLLHLEHAERPNDAFTLFNLGWAYADLGRCAEAIPLLQESLRHSHPADSITPKLYTLLAQCHRRLGQRAEAWAACQAGNARCPDDAELLFLKGQMCHERGDRAAARTCWTQLLADSLLTPNPSPLKRGRGEEEGTTLSADGVFASIDAGLRGPLVRHHLAALAREEGQPADAETQWRAALTDTPSFLPARLGLAELYLQQQRWPELETILAELEREPGAVLESVVLRGRAALARRDFVAARRLLEETIRQAPQTLTPYVLLSHVLLQTGDESAAEPVLRHIVECAPGQAESWRNLTVLYRRQKRLREALAAAQSGRLHCPDDDDLLLLHAVLLRESGDRLNAETYLLRLLESDGGDGPVRQRRATARHHLVGIYRDLGRSREAAAHRRALLAECPDFAEARRGLAECDAG
ncbi:MAG TPA: tetratricopeptide repeat protein [Gemmataceae bacterium]|jgi:tetratricopeptide (TPR) repeat protein